MEENNNVIKEIMKDDFEEGIENKKTEPKTKPLKWIGFHKNQTVF